MTYDPNTRQETPEEKRERLYQDATVQLKEKQAREREEFFNRQ